MNGAFTGVIYVIDESLSSSDSAEIEEILVHGGATRFHAESSEAANRAADVTHLISETIHVKNAAFWREGNKQVTICTRAWVMRSHVIGKQDARFFSPDPEMIFSGICVNCATDVTKSDMEAIYGAVAALGGQYRGVATKEVTHIACSVVQPEHFERVNSAHLGIKFVLPQWFEACIRSKKLCPSENYEYKTADFIPLIIRPEVITDPNSSHERTITEALKAFSKSDKSQRAFEKRRMYESLSTEDQGGIAGSQIQKRAEVEGKKVFVDKKVLLGVELCLTDSLRETLDEWVMNAGGQVGESEDEMQHCDIYITKWRDGDNYLRAIKHGLVVGTLGWFYHVVAIGRLSSPKDQLLHYPVPRRPISGFEKVQITVTNYTGESREYLRKLIVAMGADFTATMTPKTQFLIAAHKVGEKVARCEEWNVHLVNHLYLEECFRRWEKVLPTSGDGRFTDYTRVSNYMNLVGDASLSDQNLEKWTSQAFVEPPTAAEEEEMGDVDRAMLGTAATEFPSTHQATPTARDIEERDVPLGGMQEGPEAGPSRTRRRESPLDGAPAVVSDLATPLPKRRRKNTPDGPLNAITTPGSRAVETGNILSAGSKRAAATAASLKVHESALDANKFEKEKKRKDPISPKSRKASRVLPKQEESSDGEQTVTPVRKSKVGQKPATLPARAKGRTRRDSSSRPSASVATEDTADEDQPAIRKPKAGGARKIRWLTTGVVLTDQEIKAMSKLGTKQAATSDQVTHLICKSITRTPKFMTAMSTAPVIVTRDWVDACLDAGSIVDETPYHLKDTVAENTYGFSLSDALDRARFIKARGGLLSGHTFFVTDKVETDFQIMSDIVKAAGGEVVKYAKGKQRLLEAKTNDKHLISCLADKAIWMPLKAKGIKVHDRELVLRGLLLMQMDYAAHEL